MLHVLKNSSSSFWHDTFFLEFYVQQQSWKRLRAGYNCVLLQENSFPLIWCNQGIRCHASRRSLIILTSVIRLFTVLISAHWRGLVLKLTSLRFILITTIKFRPSFNVLMLIWDNTNSGEKSNQFYTTHWNWYFSLFKKHSFQNKRNTLVYNWDKTK